MTSQLQVLLLGRDRWTTETGNALLGREAFSLQPSQEQKGTVRLPDGRLLQVSTGCNIYREHLVFSILDFPLSEELISHITSAYHAVIFIMEIDSDLNLSSFLSAQVVTKNTSWENLVKRKGVIIVTGGDRFREAQRKGEITVSFIDKMRNCGRFSGTLFQATQERCLLFDNAGSEDILNKQRDELIHMIDSRVLGGAHYTDMKFKEAELFSRELNKGLQELKQKVHKNTASLEEKSLASSYTSRMLKLILLVLLLLPLLSSLWPVTSNSRKEITALDVSSDLRRYVDLKLEQAVKRIQEIEKYLVGLNKTDPNNVSKIGQEMMEQIIELKERLLNETADLIEDIKKNIRSRILVWDMIESLPLSLPLIMVLTLLVLLLIPVPLPVPWAWLIAALQVALLILHLLLLLVLLGA